MASGFNRNRILVDLTSDYIFLTHYQQAETIQDLLNNMDPGVDRESHLFGVLMLSLQGMGDEIRELTAWICGNSTIPLRPLLQISWVLGDIRMPAASTCFNHLKLSVARYSELDGEDAASRLQSDLRECMASASHMAE
mmetsp:Transcript_15306/g.33789  ORF Transcript_15306/g.33789 Transcript_15306/m.33789 type:complete len:138 (-) Transcript_15306:32-445(-)